MKLMLLILLFPLVLSAREYPGVVVSCYDGDTVTLDINCGLGITKREVVRINGIDAPERPTAAGKRSQVELMKFIMGKEVLIVTNNDKREKYGRLLANIIFGEIDVSQWMITNGLAKEYHGEKRIR